MRLLVVDDEQDLQEILKYNLEMDGYEVQTVSSAEEALDLDLKTFDLVLLDVMMDGMSGYQMAMAMKEDPHLASIPIIFVTAMGSENEKVRGLNIGADDYITKPLGMREVKARVRAVLRRAGHKDAREAEEAREKKVLRYETLVMDMENKSVSMDGTPLPLTKLEFALLRLFLSHQGKMYEREELLARCWPEDAYVLDRTVDVCITRLRKKIGRYGQHIRTRFGYGYVFE